MDCPRCGYSTNRKDLFLSHINRLSICEPTISNCTIDHLKTLYEKKDKLHKCKCGLSYTHKSSFYRHKKLCTGNTTGNTTENITVNNTVNNNINSNNVNINSNNVNIQNTVNINILPFDEKNTEYITKDFYEKCLIRTNVGFIELLKHIHFNPEHKENHNIRVKNKKLPYIEKYDGNRWNYDDKDRVLNELFKSGYELIDQYYYENESDLKANLAKTIWKNIDKFIESVDNLDKSVMKPLFKDIHFLIINNSYMILQQK